MIPKKLHYCWYGTGTQTDLNKRCIESWQKVLSEYEIKEWNESNSPLDNEYSRACYEKGEWSRLSNHTRLHALYSEGGIYLDTDVEVLKDFAPLLDRKCFVGFQQHDEDTDWVNSAIMGSVPEHQFLKRCLNLTRELFSVTGVFYRSPTIITLALKGIGLEEYGFQQLKDVTIYPCEYFYPYPWFGKYSPSCVTENTYCVHHWEGSWLKKKPNHRGRLLRAFKNKAVKI